MLELPELPAGGVPGGLPADRTPDEDGGRAAHTVLAVVGATGTGKSALADALAVSLGGEVVNADSMQVYRGMDIGTSKTPPAARSVPYHCLDLVDPGHPYTAALYQREARATIDALLTRGVTPVLCGGTGLYIRAALDDFTFDEQREACGVRAVTQGVGQSTGQDRKGVTQENSVTPAVPPTPAVPMLSPAPPRPVSCIPAEVVETAHPPQTVLRANLQAQAEAQGADAFHALLAERDPQSAALIHPRNVRRVIRAFELLEQGTSYAQQHEGFSRFTSVYPARFIGITVEPAVLYEVIERRVASMIASGLLDEVRALLAAGFREAATAQQAIGYKELVPVLDGTRSLEEAVAEIKQSTRRYAKRQRTWFKRDPRIEWLDATDLHRSVLAGHLSPQDFTHRLHDRALQLLQQFL